MSAASSSSSSAPAAAAAQKLNIATYFIMSSPTGEVDDVVADVQKLVADDAVLTADALSAILRDYNTEQMIAAMDLSTARPVLVTKHGQVGPDLYLDPATGKVLKFDHRKRVGNKQQHTAASIALCCSSAWLTAAAAVLSTDVRCVRAS
jgi:hypothetical protein